MHDGSEHGQLLQGQLELQLWRSLVLFRATALEATGSSLELQLWRPLALV